MPKKPIEEQTIQYRVSIRVKDLNKALAAAMLPPIQSEEEADQWRHHRLRAEDFAKAAGQSENDRFKALTGLCYPLMMAFGQSGTGVLEAAGKENTEWSCDLSQPPEHYESVPGDVPEITIRAEKRAVAFKSLPEDEPKPSKKYDLGL